MEKADKPGMHVAVDFGKPLPFEEFQNLLGLGLRPARDPMEPRLDFEFVERNLPIASSRQFHARRPTPPHQSSTMSRWLPRVNHPPEHLHMDGKKAVPEQTGRFISKFP